MKNIVFIPNIDLGNGRGDNYSYCIKSWKYWCDENDCELLLLEDLLLPVRQVHLRLKDSQKNNEKQRLNKNN